MIPVLHLPAGLQGTAALLVTLSVLGLPPAILLAAAGMRGLLGRRGAGRLALGALALCLWLFLPWQPALPEARQLSVFVSTFGWLWLVMGWMRLVWRKGFGPAPLNALGGLLLLAGVAGLGLAVRGMLAP